MPSVVPPAAPPQVGFSGSDGLKRTRLRLWQILMTGVTLAIASWFCTLGAIPAIVTLFIAKHVLVAILFVGLEPAKELNEPA